MKGMRIFMENKFHFTPPFLESFKETINIMSEKLNELNTFKGSDVYGICNCSYRMRYFTPKNVSTYIDYIHKGMQNNLIGSNPHDIELFAVEAAKRFMIENACESFDQPSIMGNNFAGEEHPTLQDLLLLHSNEVYEKVVCTPYELNQRKEGMSKDIKTFNDMHFPANMKKLIQEFPNVVEKMDDGAIYMNQPLVGKLFRAMVEEFIIFATTINMITVSSMVDFCKPVSAFRSNNEVTMELDTGDSINEQVDTTSNSVVYFVFGQGKTPFISKAIKKATDSPYSHITISFDSKLNDMYSFGRGGVRKEDVNGEYYNDIDIVVYGAYIPNDKINEMKRICDSFIDNKDKTTFDFGLLIKKLFLDDGSLPKNEYHQICTTFVNHLFKSVDLNVMDKNIPSPKEFKDKYDSKKDQFHQIYSGKAQDVKPEKLEKRMETFANGKKSNVINEYVTECTMLKTNEISNAHQLPFNCNIRNIVLSDSSEDFDNTIAAVKFILNDSRSPIHSLLVRFATIKRETHFPVEMVKQAFFTHHSCTDNPICLDEIRPGFARHETQWLDKIVYGSKFMDANYRDDTPGNMHYHPIEYDISTIYRMFSCHHNDNEHLANNIVRVANIMRGLIDDYRGVHFTIRDRMCDILAVFAEILTKDMLLLYHNNNQVIVYKDDMPTTMIPGYMYCESFVMEADENKTKEPGIENKNNLNAATRTQKAGFAIKTLLQNFQRYIQQTLQNVAPKFFEAHAAERKWIKDHKSLNDEILKAINDTKFSIELTDYPGFKVPAAKAMQDPVKAANELKKHLNNPEELNKYLTSNDENGKPRSVDTIIKSLLYPDVAKAVQDVNNDNDVRDKTHNYICYGDPNHQQSKERVPLDQERWNDILNLISDAKDVGTFSAVEKISKETNSALADITNSLSRLVNMEKKQTTGDNNGQQQSAGDTDSQIQTLFNAISKVSNNCWLAALKFLMNDVYGTTYKLYRKIIMEYQRQNSLGVQNNDNADQTQKAPENQNTEEVNKQ